MIQHVEHEGKSILFSRHGIHSISDHRATGITNGDFIPTAPDLWGVQMVLMPKMYIPTKAEYQRQMAENGKVLLGTFRPRDGYELHPVHKQLS